MISSGRPSVQNARPWMLWLWAAHSTSGRAAWMAEWIMNAAALSSRQGPPSITSPEWLTWIRSEALICEKATPNGFTQKVVGSTGSRRVMCPATPAELA
jgi:hypothetical protein